MFVQEKFSADQTVVELKGLLPATDYSVTLYALYDEDPSDPVTSVASTREKLYKNLFSVSFYYEIAQIELAIINLTNGNTIPKKLTFVKKNVCT